MATTEPPSQTESEETFDEAAFHALPAEQLGGHHNRPQEDEHALAQHAAAAAHAVSAPCKRDFTAIHTSGTRSLAQIRLIVIHSSEGDTARGGASWFTDARSGGSAHLVVDDHECYRTLANEVVPWGAPGANTNGFHIEHAGWAHKWDRATWLAHEQTLRRGAFKAALHANRFGIPIRWLSVDDLRHGRSGFVTHATVTEFHPTPEHHTDPGDNFPHDHYLELVKEFAAELEP
jgi:N-acetylmuramoyl-L-alanine amidase